MRVASVRLRLLAACVDAVIVIAGLVAVVGVGIAAAAAYARLRGEKDEPSGEPDPEPDDDRQDEPSGEPDPKPDDDRDDEPSSNGFGTPSSRRSPHLHAALRGAAAGLAIASRNWRGPGYRWVGLRRVDARTGGNVTVRSALIGNSYDEAWHAAWRQLFASRVRRGRTRLEALAPQLRAVQRTHDNDPQARQKAVSEFYKTHDVNLAGGCGWLLAGPLVSQLVVALSSRGGRTIRDRITGTVVVVDRGRRATTTGALIQRRLRGLKQQRFAFRDY
jgi:hypothetical protein